jgi:AraC-like DNA-binding protein
MGPHSRKRLDATTYSTAGNSCPARRREMSTSAMSRAPEPETRPVPITSIQKEPRATNGIALNPGRVAAFSDLMRAGAMFPPIKVWRDGDIYWLSDGLHTLAAAEQAGMTDPPCEVCLGTFSDAQWDSYGSNRIHASPHSPAEMRNFLALALQHPIAATLSDAQIASHLGVATSFVRYWKKRLPPKGAGHAAPIKEISDEIVRKAVRDMPANLASDLNVRKLARQIGVSASHLRRRFRLTGGSGPKAMLTDLRMERARELLTATDLSTKEIACQLAYRRADEFSRAFARVHGTAPRAWREAQARPPCR